MKKDTHRAKDTLDLLFLQDKYAAEILAPE